MTRERGGPELPVLRTRRSPRSSGGDRDLRPRADARPRDDDRARYLADGPPGRSASAAIRPEGGLVARSRELAHLDHVLWKARAGSSSAVALRGEPGLGKSALIEATVARSADFSVIRLAGAALEVSGTVPPGWPGPVVELLSAQDPDTLPAPPARTSERRRGARPFVGTVASAAHGWSSLQPMPSARCSERFALPSSLPLTTVTCSPLGSRRPWRQRSRITCAIFPSWSSSHGVIPPICPLSSSPEGS